MDLFTQNMINRTKQRQELLSKLKPNSSVVSSSAGVNVSENVKQMTDLSKTGKSLSSESNQTTFKESTGNDIRKEKENNYLSKSNKTTALTKPASTAHQLPITVNHAFDQVGEPNSFPAAKPGSRRTRLDALAYRINDWEDESLSNLKQTALLGGEKKFKTPTKDDTEKNITKVTPGKAQSSVKELNSPTARRYVPGPMSTKVCAPTSFPTTAADHVNAVTSPTKAVVLDKSVLHCLESQGFKPTASRSRLIYEYEKEQETELEDEAAKSWTYSAGTPEKRVSGRLDNRSPAAALKDSPKNKPIRSPIYITKTDQSKKSPLILNQKPISSQKNCNSSKDIKAVTILASPLKRSGNSMIAAQSSSKKEATNLNDVGVSVLKRVAQFDSPRLPARDPAEFSLSERKALFEKNKGKPPTPKFASPDVSRPAVKNASPINTAFNLDQNYGLCKSTMEHSLSAFKNASNAKAERMKELQELRNRHGEKRQPESTIGPKTPSRESAFEIVEENQSSRIQSNLAIVNSSSPEKSSLSMPKLENAKGFRKSPAKDSYAGLHEVKPIRVSPPKPGKLYPCLSDIEMTTENETDSDDSEDIASPSDSSPVANMNTSQDLDSSFTTDILGRAGLSQFINTPKKKLQEMQLNKQALLRSIAEHNLIVSDDDSEEIGEISDLLNEALEQHNSSGESTPPKQLKLDRKSLSVEEDDPTMLYHSVSSYRKQQQDQTATPVRQVVRNPEVRSTHNTSSKSNELHEIPVQQQIRNLQEEINTQQTVMAQASQALNLCRATAEFSGSTEQVEGEKLLLVASQKRQAAMNEIQRLKTEAAMKKPSGGYASRGTLSISGLSLPLKRDFVAMQSKGGDDYIHYFIMLIRHRGQVIPLQMLSTLDGIQEGALRFPNLIQLRDLPADFQVAIEVYALQTKKEKLDHNQKYHIRKDTSKMRLTPKKLASKQESRLLSKTPLSSPAGPSAVRNSSFGLVGFTTISSTSLRRQEWSLEKVPFASPIDGALQLKIQCHTESLIEERGFLTVFEDVGGFGAWHRRWCLLSNDQLLFWKYPDDEKRKEPLNYINLRKCVTEHVDAVSHDICARPNTFLLVTVRESIPGDKDSLVMTCYPHRTALRHLISADLKDERQLWCSQLNRAIGNLRAWDIDSQQPSTEGSTPKIIG